MATELDLFGIKEAVVTLLQANATLYDATGASGKVRVIEAGVKSEDFFKTAGTLPRIVITNSSFVEENKLVGSVRSDAQSAIQHTVRFLIFLLVEGKDGQKSEETADDFCKLIKETIDAAYDLSNNVDGAYIEKDERLTSDFGADKQVRRLTLKCMATTS